MYVVYGKLREEYELPTSHTLIFNDRLFGSLPVVVDKVWDMLNLQVAAISRRARPHSVATELQLSQLNTLKMFLYEYVPSLFFARTHF